MHVKCFVLSFTEMMVETEYVFKTDWPEIIATISFKFLSYFKNIGVFLSPYTILIIQYHIGLQNVLKFFFLIDAYH